MDSPANRLSEPAGLSPDQDTLMMAWSPFLQSCIKEAALSRREHEIAFPNAGRQKFVWLGAQSDPGNSSLLIATSWTGDV
jgi:hypothetical protein